MARKRFALDQIITMLREAEVLLNHATPVAEVCRMLWDTKLGFRGTSNGFSATKVISKKGLE